VQKILVDGSEFGFEHFVQNGNNLWVAFHSSPLFFFSLLLCFNAELDGKNSVSRSRAQLGIA
jgi:hypothetical protein